MHKNSAMAPILCTAHWH